MSDKTLEGLIGEVEDDLGSLVDEIHAGRFWVAAMVLRDIKDDMARLVPLADERIAAGYRAKRAVAPDADILDGLDDDCSRLEAGIDDGPY